MLVAKVERSKVCYTLFLVDDFVLILNLTKLNTKFLPSGVDKNTEIGLVK